MNWLVIGVKYQTKIEMRKRKKSGQTALLTQLCGIVCKKIMYCVPVKVGNSLA